MKTKLKKNETLSARIAGRHKKYILEKYGSYQKFLDLAVELGLKGLLKPLDRVLHDIEKEYEKSAVEALVQKINNKEALESYQDYEEPDDSLDKRLEDA